MANPDDPPRSMGEMASYAGDMFKAGAQDWYESGIGHMLGGVRSEPGAFDPMKNRRDVIDDYKPANFEQRFAPSADMPKANVEMLQQIVSHPEFGNLLQMIALQSSAPSQAVPDPFNTRVQGKDQSRVVPARYPGDR